MDRAARLDLAADPHLQVLLGRALAGDLLRQLERHRQHPLVVGEGDVAGEELHAGHVDRQVVVHRDQVAPAGGGVEGGGVDRQPDLLDIGRVAHRAVDHRGDRAARLDAGGQDVADDPGGGHAERVDAEDVARFERLDGHWQGP